MEETVVISKDRYEELLKSERWLSCLEGCGVDNWAGFDDAVVMMKEYYPEDYKD